VFETLLLLNIKTEFFVNMLFITGVLIFQVFLCWLSFNIKRNEKEPPFIRVSIAVASHVF